MKTNGDNYKQQLISILLGRSVQFGDFTLSSGKKTKMYIDGKQTMLTPGGSWSVGNLILSRLKPEIIAVGGLCLGAVPIVSSVTTVSWIWNRPVHGFLIRKTAKQHGTCQWIEGVERLPYGGPVCILEDVCPTGDSVLDAITKAENEGLQVAQVITIVDRQEGALERIAAAGYHLESLVLKEDLLN